MHPDVEPSCGRGFRIERDPLGELRVPADAYYGVQTARAVENFPISGLRRPPISSPPRFSSRRPPPKPTRRSAGSTADIADAIVAAADEILAGALRDQFVVDVYQAGAGTSHNMNANEVLANRAAEILGEPRGDLHARAPERSRQHGPVDERRVPDGDAARAAARAAGARSTQRARARRRRSRAKSARVRARAEDRTHAPAGRGADHARPGVRRLRRHASRTRRGRRRARRRSSCTS